MSEEPNNFKVVPDDEKQSPLTVVEAIRACEEKTETKIMISNQEEWDKQISLDKKSDFARRIFVFADVWACLMQAKIQKGASVMDVAESTYFEANIVGITAFEYGYAVDILIDCWEYGEELKGWANVMTAKSHARSTAFAKAWSSLMQAEIKNGKSVMDVAESTYLKVKTETISVIEYAAALNSLISTWEYGRELWEWAEEYYVSSQAPAQLLA